MIYYFHSESLPLYLLTPREKVKLPKRQKAHGYREPDYSAKFIAEEF